MVEIAWHGECEAELGVFVDFLLDAVVGCGAFLCEVFAEFYFEFGKGIGDTAAYLIGMFFVVACLHVGGGFVVFAAFGLATDTREVGLVLDVEDDFFYFEFDFDSFLAFCHGCFNLFV